MSDEEYFTNWAAEYSATAQTLKERIHELQSRMKHAKNMEAARLSARIEILYAGYRDCTGVARDLLAHARRAAAREQNKN